MPSVPLFSAGTVRRPMASVNSTPAQIFAQLAALPKLAEVTPASRLTIRPTPRMASSGVCELDALTGGLPRGCLTEICGSVSSGRASLLLALLAAATSRQEACALVDVSDSFDPASAALAKVHFENLLWIRCSAAGQQKNASPNGPKKKHFAENVDHALRVTDLLLQSGGFGLIIIDLADVAQRLARRIPLTSWFRFQRAIEHTSTVLVVITQTSCAQTCATMLLQLSAFGPQPSANTKPAHAHLLENLHIETELLRTSLTRKPAQSTAFFHTQSVCTG